MVPPDIRKPESTRVIRLFGRVLYCVVCFLAAVVPLRAAGLPQSSGSFDCDRPDTLRILGVGNSFTDDGMMLLPGLLRAAGVGNVVLGRLYFPGCSLEQHCRFYADDAPNYVYSKSSGGGEWYTADDRATLVEALEDERWDIVVLQQASHFSGRYDSYGPWLERLEAVVWSHNANPCLRIAWQMTWAYASDSDHDGFAVYGRDTERMYRAILDAVRRMRRGSGIGLLVPTGTAVQRARAAVASPRELTRDGYHLDLGAGRYVAACTWFEALVAPFAERSVRGNALRIAAAPETTPVDDEVAARCQEAAVTAVCDPFAGMTK